MINKRAVLTLGFGFGRKARTHLGLWPVAQEVGGWLDIIRFKLAIASHVRFKLK